MSQPFHVAAQPDPPKPPSVRLPTWVNVVLVLILLSSCGADRLSAGSVADEVVQRLGSSGTGDVSTAGLASEDDVIDMCRLLGAVAVKQGVPLTVMNKEVQTRCHEVAQEAASGATP